MMWRHAFPVVSLCVGCLLLIYQQTNSARSKLRKACKSWLKCKSNIDNKQEFIRAQKALSGRRNVATTMLHLLLQQKQNIRQFWNKVKKLGVAGIKSQSIPMEVELEDALLKMRCFITPLGVF